MLIEPKLTNTSKNFGKPPEKQNPVNNSFYNLTLLLLTLLLFLKILILINFFCILSILVITKIRCSTHRFF